MVYVALLRGINVGGKNMVSMKSLKQSFERLGYQDVSTYINSGNVLFRAAVKDARKLEQKIDDMLGEEYGLTGKTVVRSLSELERLVAKIAATWEMEEEWRYNVIYLRHSIDSKNVLEAFELKPDIEEVIYCPGTLLWSARADDMKRSTFAKLPGKAIFQDMTVRNVNTTRKVCELMQRMEGATR